MNTPLSFTASGKKADYHANNSGLREKEHAISVSTESPIRDVARLDTPVVKRGHQGQTFRAAERGVNANSKYIDPAVSTGIEKRLSNSAQAQVPQKKLGGQAFKDVKQLLQGDLVADKLPPEGQLRTQAIGKIISGEADDSQKQINQQLLTLHAENKNNKQEDRSVRVIGAGPAGQLQALKGYEQGLNVKITEKRPEFSRGQNIFQISKSDFQANVGKYLSESTVNTLSSFGVINFIENHGQESVAIAINDLENVLSGIINAQSELSSSAITLEHNSGVSPADIQSGLDADIIIAAVGAGPVRDEIIRDALPADTVEVVQWNNNPRGFALKLDISQSSEDTVQALKNELSGLYPEKGQINFLPLPEQGKLQVNFALSEDAFIQWQSQSPRKDNGELDYSQYKQVKKSHLDLAQSLIPVDQIKDDSVKTFLEHSLTESAYKTSGWVNENSITRLSTPASLIQTADRSDPIPLIFIGDAQANNWFLFGDGNPREHAQAEIVSDHLFKSIPGDIQTAVNSINDQSVREILLDNTKIPGSYARTPGLSQSTDTVPTTQFTDTFRGL